MWFLRLVGFFFKHFCFVCFLLYHSACWETYSKPFGALWTLRTNFIFPSITHLFFLAPLWMKVMNADLSCVCMCVGSGLLIPMTFSCSTWQGCSALVRSLTKLVTEGRARSLKMGSVCWWNAIHSRVILVGCWSEAAGLAILFNVLTVLNWTTWVLYLISKLNTRNLRISNIKKKSFYNSLCQIIWTLFGIHTFFKLFLNQSTQYTKAWLPEYQIFCIYCSQSKSRVCSRVSVCTNWITPELYSPSPKNSFNTENYLETPAFLCFPHWNSFMGYFPFLLFWLNYPSQLGRVFSFSVQLEGSSLLGFLWNWLLISVSFHQFSPNSSHCPNCSQVRKYMINSPKH